MVAKRGVERGGGGGRSSVQGDLLQHAAPPLAAPPPPPRTSRTGNSTQCASPCYLADFSHISKVIILQYSFAIIHILLYPLCPAYRTRKH